ETEPNHRPPASQHTPKPRSDCIGVRTLGCADTRARAEKICTFVDTEPGASACGDKRAPGPVSQDDRSGCIDHTDFAGQPIEGAQQETARALQCSLCLGK